jgi:hypothetical protein
MRNNGVKDLHVSRRASWDVFRTCAERTLFHYEGQAPIIYRLPRSAQLLPRLVGKFSALARFILEFWGRMRWWAYGAFGNKGRLEGGQYLAGRRAPPLLHR